MNNFFIFNVSGAQYARSCSGVCVQKQMWKRLI